MRVVRESGVYYIVTRIPLVSIGQSVKNLHPVRINLRVQKRGGETSDWLPNNPLTSRLVLASDNPGDLGWLLFR